MRILLTNDDGIQGAGLKALVEALKDEHELYVFAPDGQQSSASHRVTYIHQPVKFVRWAFPGTAEAFAVSGTPADCTYIGLAYMKEKPDLVISGINKGQNISTDCIYSGTVAAAREALINGIPAVSASLADNHGTDFSAAGQAVREIIPFYMQDEHRLQYLLNINVPRGSYEELKGFRAVRFEQPFTYCLDTEIQKIDEEEFRLVLKGGNIAGDATEEGGDFRAVREGYVTLTPLVLDQVGYPYLENLKNWKITKGQ